MTDTELYEKIFRLVLTRETKLRPQIGWRGQVRGSVYTAWTTCPIRGLVGLMRVTLPLGDGQEFFFNLQVTGN